MSDSVKLYDLRGNLIDRNIPDGGNGGGSTEGDGGNTGGDGDNTGGDGGNTGGDGGNTGGDGGNTGGEGNTEEESNIVLPDIF